MQPMTDAEIEQALHETPEWSLVGDAIQRTVKFDSFLKALAYVSRVATEAERVQHHPDILIRYNKVTLSLSTHDAGGITGKDFSFARTCDALVGA